MRKLTIAAAVLVVGLAGMATAHVPEGELFFAFQFEDCCVPNVDGFHDDWAFVPADPYEIRSDRLFSPAKTIRDVGRGTYDPSDVNIRHRFGFNPNNDYFYVATDIFDNFHDSNRENPGKFWYDDDWEVRLNTSAVAADEQNLEGVTDKVIYTYAVPAVEGVYQNILPGSDLPWFVDPSENMRFGWTWEGEQLGAGDSIYRYELQIHPVDQLGDTAENTNWTDVEEGDVYHINIDMVDSDGDEPAVGSQNGFWGIIEGWAPEGDLVMAPLEDVSQTPTAVQEVSWAMIKAGVAE